MSQENPQKGVERRNFLKTLSLIGVGGLVLSKDIIASGKSSSPSVSNSDVVVVHNDFATNKTTKKVDSTVIQSMVDEAIITLTGISDIGEAWKSIFPGITETKVIALKVSTLFYAGHNGTHSEITYAVANGLQQMKFNDTFFPANNIVIFDLHDNYLTNKGYIINKGNTGIRCYPNSVSNGYTTETYDVAGVKVNLSKVITETADYMVNLAYLKQHSITGISLCMKNHYGSIKQPESLHGKYGDPYLPALNALEPIKSKQKLCIIDGLFSIINGGPDGNPSANPNKIFMSKDITAIDAVGHEALKGLGMSSAYSKMATYIATASSKYALGVSDISSINVVNIENTAISTTNIENETKNQTSLHNYPNPFNESTTIEFNLVYSGIVKLSIADYSGREIEVLINKRLDAGTHKIVWNGASNHNGNIFMAIIKTDSFHNSILMQYNK